MHINRILVLKNTIQPYAWGSKEYISQLLTGSSPSQSPQAELWMGTHPGAPSFVVLKTGKCSLVDFIKNEPEAVLGSYTASRFNNTLPFLFKVLAAEKPLSIQAHPNKLQAEQGFTRENEIGIPLTARNRIYKDDNHKPEIICALTPFIALNGFRPIRDIIMSLEAVKSNALMSIIKHLKHNNNEKGLRHIFNMIMTLPLPKKREIITDILTFAHIETTGDPKKQWIIFLHKEYPEDIGIISMFLLHFIRLNPGQAMYLPACQFHSYIHGAGIELMANSDNVLRGGLTPKYIDIPELLKIVNFSESTIQILQPEINEKHERVYNTLSEEFLLSSITLKQGDTYTSLSHRSAEILLCIDGKAHITESPSRNSMTFQKGMSLLIPAGIKQYKIQGSAHIFKAAVPTP